MNWFLIKKQKQWLDKRQSHAMGKKRRVEAYSALRAAVQQTLTERDSWLISVACIVLRMKG